MKRFHFSLDTVLDYKQQVLDSLRAEHGTVLVRLRRQEAALEAAQARYDQANAQFREKKETGMTVAEAMGYETGLRVLDGEIGREQLQLEEIQREEAAKREEVVEARKETASLEKLREKKLDCYNKDVQKSEEAFIDELVSAARFVAVSG